MNPESKGISTGVSRTGGPRVRRIFIDTLATDLESHLGNDLSQIPARVYGNDVIIHVENTTDLQFELLVRKNWAHRVGMTWALSKVKSQDVLSRRMAERYKQFPFAGSTT